MPCPQLGTPSPKYSRFVTTIFGCHIEQFDIFGSSRTLVYLQVASHCATAVLDNNERTSKLAQKLVRAGVLQPLCALLALAVPIEAAATAHAADVDATSAALFAPVDTALCPRVFTMGELGTLGGVMAPPAVVATGVSTWRR